MIVTALQFLAQVESSMKRSIYCCACQHDTDARLTTGVEIYPHRKDLAGQPFWLCDTCGNYVGCHHKTKDRTRPMGVIATDEIRQLRRQIHAILDPLWQAPDGRTPRREGIYAEISERIGESYHTGEIRSAEQARKILEIVKAIAGR
jgi:ribosomal protein L37AE/L43A